MVKYYYPDWNNVAQPGEQIKAIHAQQVAPWPNVHPRREPAKAAEPPVPPVAKSRPSPAFIYAIAGSCCGAQIVYGFGFNRLEGIPEEQLVQELKAKARSTGMSLVFLSDYQMKQCAPLVEKAGYEKLTSFYNTTYGPTAGHIVTVFASIQQKERTPEAQAFAESTPGTYGIE